MEKAYFVEANTEYETVSGQMLEEPLRSADAETIEEAREIARAFYDKGGCSSIYIGYRHKDSPCFYNPVGGHNIVGQDWIPQFEFEDAEKQKDSESN